MIKHILSNVCFLFFFCVALIAQKDINQNEIPNIIIILADDLGYKDVGFNGSIDIPTPNIDRIANEGVKFRNAYVSYAVCGPSRAGLITGRYQDRFGFSRNPLFAPNDVKMGLPLSELTLADALSPAGYKSIALGKWHLGAHPDLHPLKRGFDDFYGFLSGGHDYFPELYTLNGVYDAKKQYDGYKTKLLRNYERVEEKEYLTDALSREAVNYIEKYKDQPFFMYLAYNAPHTPLQATEKYLERFENIKNEKRKIYGAMVSAMDDGVGRVLNKLEELKISENTMVFFLSDNGGPERVNASDNGLLRGGKGDLFEGGVHVPFALRWPDKIDPMVYDSPVSALDIFATAINPVKNEITLKNPLDGVDLLPFLQGTNNGMPHSFLFWRKYDQKWSSVRKSDGEKLLKNPKDTLLFNLKKDISETNEMKDEDLMHNLLDQYQLWENNLRDPVFLGLLQNDLYNRKHPDRFTKPD
ncbi:sulfatase-like hydrolase/transferase [Christiangramia crocea]|uniref:sulfatase-like hydrolase/transferase n=1 Tax=Christiangramia crocea TaxID=2904124 RepID=UPI0021076821|nr:sulfatase-like hydrolase/transferase [Gramella crocea]